MTVSKLFTKLNLKEQPAIVVLNAPPGFGTETGRLQGVTVHGNLPRSGPISFALAFVTRQAEVDLLAKSIAKLAQGDAVVWFAYPKKTSRRYHCDFSRDTGWATLAELGYEGVRLVAIDGDWSAMRFRRTEYIKSFKRDVSRALSVRGQQRAASNEFGEEPEEAIRANRTD
ncbi:MAG: hypothetical protein WBS20_01780 [Lysobacterales bacterium]